MSVTRMMESIRDHVPRVEYDLCLCLCLYSNFQGALF